MVYPVVKTIMAIVGRRKSRREAENRSAPEFSTMVIHRENKGMDSSMERNGKVSRHSGSRAKTVAFRQDGWLIHKLAEGDVPVDLSFSHRFVRLQVSSPFFSPGVGISSETFLARIMHETLSRDHGDGRATGQP